MARFQKYWRFWNNVWSNLCGLPLYHRVFYMSIETAKEWCPHCYKWPKSNFRRCSTLQRVCILNAQLLALQRIGPKLTSRKLSVCSRVYPFRANRQMQVPSAPACFCLGRTSGRPLPANHHPNYPIPSSQKDNNAPNIPQTPLCSSNIIRPVTRNLMNESNGCCHKGGDQC